MEMFSTNNEEYRLGVLEQKVSILEFKVNMLEAQRDIDQVVQILEKNDKLFKELAEIGKEFDEKLAQSLTEPSEKR